MHVTSAKHGKSRNWLNKQAFYQQITPGLKPFPYLPFS